jgi:hypothetical protein
VSAWVAESYGRRVTGHGESVAAYRVSRRDIPGGHIEVSMYESDEAGRMLAERVAEAMNLLDETRP